MGKYPSRAICNLHRWWLEKRYKKSHFLIKNKEMDVWDRRVEKLDDFIQDFYNATINKVLDNRTQKVKVRIDKYDTWSMYTTLSHIILPMLVQLKETKHGAPNVDLEDVPEHLRPSEEEIAKYKENGDTDDKFFERWDWVLGEMIWAMSEIASDEDGESQFFTGENDMQFIPIDENRNVCSEEEADAYQLVKGPNDTREIDMDGLKAYNARIDNGCRLFGKYFRNLWD